MNLEFIKWLDRSEIDPAEHGNYHLMYEAFLGGIEVGAEDKALEAIIIGLEKELEGAQQKYQNLKNSINEFSKGIDNSVESTRPLVYNDITDMISADHIVHNSIILDRIEKVYVNQFKNYLKNAVGENGKVVKF